MELFILTVEHCSGGHGDVTSIMGVYDNFRTPHALAQQVEDEGLSMRGLDHGATIWRLHLNFTVPAKDYRIVYKRRFSGYAKQRGENPWKDEWFDRSVKDKFKSKK